MIPLKIHNGGSYALMEYLTCWKQATNQAEISQKISNTEADRKKALLIKKKEACSSCQKSMLQVLAHFACKVLASVDV